MANTNFEAELETLLNKTSQENDSNTPDFILAEFLTSCLEAWNSATKKRDKWYGVKLEPGKLNTDRAVLEDLLKVALQYRGEDGETKVGNHLINLINEALAK